MSFLSQAQALYIEERFDEAAAMFSEHLKELTDITGVSGRAACYFHLKRYSDALQDLNLALRLGSQKYIDHYRKGVCLFELEEYEAAKDAFEKALLIKRQEAPDADTAPLDRYLRKCQAEISGNLSILIP